MEAWWGRYGTLITYRRVCVWEVGDGKCCGGDDNSKRREGGDDVEARRKKNMRGKDGELSVLAGNGEPSATQNSDGSRRAILLGTLVLSHRWGIETAEAQLG